MAKKKKTVIGERNFSCLNYSACLTEAAINNSVFNCAGCDKVVLKTFNDLLRYESSRDTFDTTMITKKKISKSRK